MKIINLIIIINKDINQIIISIIYKYLVIYNYNY